MEEIKYLKDTKVEITARRIDNDVYIHQASVIELLKDYKQQFSLQGVSQQRELLVGFINWHDKTLGVDADKESNTLFVNEYLKTN